MEKRRNQLKPGTTIPNHLQRNKKYITSIMDEESSDHMDETDIPMLVSGYIIVLTMGSKIWGPDIYMASKTE